MERYIINEKTMYIKGIREDKHVYSLVKEMGSPVQKFKLKPGRIIEDSCFFYNTTYPSRKETSRVIASISHKPPIVLKPESYTYVFPTHSDRVVEGSWLNLHFITSFHKGEYNDTIVHFDDGTVEHFPVSIYIFNTQYLNAIKLEYCLRTKAIKNQQIVTKTINYEKSRMSIFEVLAMYALLDE